MIQTKQFSKSDAIAVLIKKSANVIDVPTPTDKYVVSNNPVKGEDGNWFFNIEAMSSYHVAQAHKMIAQGKFSEATKGFGITVWENQMSMISDIVKGGQVWATITEYHAVDKVTKAPLFIKDANGNDVPDMRLRANLIKPIVPQGTERINKVNEFASYLEPEVGINDTNATDEPQ